MSKTKTITVENLKAVTSLSIDFNGCCAIITGGNDKGKSSFLKSIPDRIRGEKPQLIVREGQKNGKGIMELTTGEKFVWEFDVEGKDKLTFFTKDGIKTGVSKEIAKRCSQKNKAQCFKNLSGLTSLKLIWNINLPTMIGRTRTGRQNRKGLNLEAMFLCHGGILVDGLPLDKNQISTSKYYISALRLASIGLGEVKTLHFDASYLDNNNLREIEKWAEEKDLQLFIERPDLDGGEIKYELIESASTSTATATN